MQVIQGYSFFVDTLYSVSTVNPLIEARSLIQAGSAIEAGVYEDFVPVEAGSLLEAGVNENIEYDSILGYRYSCSFILVLIYVHAICIGLSIR